MLLQTMVRSTFNYTTNQWVRESLTDLWNVILFFVWVIKNILMPYYNSIKESPYYEDDPRSVIKKCPG
jgi:hypothetical protein